MSPSPVFVLGGCQTDFARNVTREGGAIVDLIREAAHGALTDAGVRADQVEVGHVGNFAAELFVGQGHLGGLLVEADPAFAGLPTSRHEAACASGGVAVLAAMADLQAGRYDVALVLGVELMRNGPTLDAAHKLGAAAWVPRETEGLPQVWPEAFSRVGDEYDRRYGLRREHLVALARNAFDCARDNPLAQTRRWTLGPHALDEDAPENPVVAGRLHKYDCSQVTDGAAAVVLASERFVRANALRAPAARLAGFGHRTSRMALADKLADSRGEPFVFPHVRRAITDAFARAGLAGAADLDVIETHDCFTTTTYMAIDHFGITPPGQSWQAIEDGTVLRGGKLPVNPGGGLMGIGHPVGASGVRMVLDAARQVTGTAGKAQVPGARRAATLNLGGSATTSVCFVIERVEGEAQR